MESWLSGRKHLTANEAGFKRPRGFKSHTLRTNKNPHIVWVFNLSAWDLKKLPAIL